MSYILANNNVPQGAITALENKQLPEQTKAANPRTLFSVASDLDGIQNYLRISQEMVMDELCNSTPSDFESMERLHERVFFIMDQFPEKIAQMERFNSELITMSGAEKTATA